MPGLQNASLEERQRYGSKGGRIGGPRRAQALSQERRSEIAREGARARWGGLTAEQRKIERARGREPKQSEKESQPKAKTATA